MRRARTALPVQRMVFVESEENVVIKNAWIINLKASGMAPNFKEDRGILAKAGPS